MTGAEETLRAFGHRIIHLEAECRRLAAEADLRGRQATALANCVECLLGLPYTAPVFLNPSTGQTLPDEMAVLCSARQLLQAVRVTQPPPNLPTPGPQAESLLPQ